MWLAVGAREGCTGYRVLFLTYTTCSETSSYLAAGSVPHLCSVLHMYSRVGHLVAAPHG